MAWRSTFLASACVTAIALAACAKNDERPGDAATAATPAATGAAAPAIEPAINFAAAAAAAVANPARPEADRADDERRKAAAALEFFRVGPGMTVFEIEAGAGWYTELLSHLAGPDGAVIMQNPEGFRSFVGEQIDARLAGNRLANVRASLSNFDALDAADASVDVATWVQGPHELYFTPSEGESLGDPARAYAEVFRILKPGGIFAVIDHSALSGAPESAGNELHRVDRAIVVEMAETAGFGLEAESAFLANPDDPRTVTVFDPAIRGRTDQFALRFRKP
ncbi:MAG: class I SAM-dependent methyltransferase, partial [Parvularculaceae bacterium]